MVADAGAFVVEDEAFGVAGTEGVPHDVAEGDIDNACAGGTGGAGGGGCGRYMDTVLAEDGCIVVAGAGGGIGEGFVSLLTEAFHPRHFQGRHVGEVLAASTFY